MKSCAIFSTLITINTRNVNKNSVKSQYAHFVPFPRRGYTIWSDNEKRSLGEKNLPIIRRVTHEAFKKEIPEFEVGKSTFMNPISKQALLSFPIFA